MVDFDSDDHECVLSSFPGVFILVLNTTHDRLLFPLMFRPWIIGWLWRLGFNATGAQDLSAYQKSLTTPFICDTSSISNTYKMQSERTIYIAIIGESKSGSRSPYQALSIIRLSAVKSSPLNFAPSEWYEDNAERQVKLI